MYTVAREKQYLRDKVYNYEKLNQISKLTCSRIELAYLMVLCKFVKLLRRFGSIRHFVAGARGYRDVNALGKRAKCI